MALFYDAPSTDWETATLLNPKARTVFPIYQTTQAYILERDYVQNPGSFFPTDIDTPFQTTTLDSTLSSGELTTISCVSVGQEGAAHFPGNGRVRIGSEFINYTGIDRSANTLTGLTRGQPEGIKTSSPATHSAGADVDFAAWLIEETSPVPQEGGLVRWTRRFASVPDTWSDYEMRPYQFPGYFNDTGDTYYRNPYKQVVLWRVYHYYEHAPAASVIGTIEVPAQAFQSENTFGAPLEYVDATSAPTYTTYAAAVSAGTYMVPSDSVMERYAGNIWVTKKFFTPSL
jgi:hypothetical protein